MGGGAAMRAAGKATGMGIFSGGWRGGKSVPQPAEQALRNVARPAAVVSSGVSSGADVSAIQKASWEADWEFAGVEEVLASERQSPEPIARVVFDAAPTLQASKDATADLKVVFDAAPTLQEAKDATADLKYALEKVYLLSPELGGRVKDGPVPLLANSDNLETKSCVTCDPKLASVPTSALNAFKLLSESSAVQSVVASIAADPNVWDAVKENRELKEFMLSQKSSVAVEVQEPPTTLEESTDSSPGVDTASQSGYTENGVNKFFQKVKNSVVEMVSNVSGFFQNRFGLLPAEKASSDADVGSGIMEKTIGASLMGLAIMVITVVVLKRV